MEAAPLLDGAFRETRPSPLLAPHWSDRVMCHLPHPELQGGWEVGALSLPARGDMGRARAGPYRTGDSVTDKAVTWELHSPNKCRLSTCDAPGPRDTSRSLARGLPLPGGIVPPGRETAVPPVQLACRGDALALRLVKEGHLAESPGSPACSPACRHEGCQGQGCQARAQEQEWPLGRGPRVFQGKPCAQWGARTSQRGRPSTRLCVAVDISLGQGVVAL